MMEMKVITGAIRSAGHRARQINTINKATPNFLQAGCPSCHPTNSVNALKESMARDTIPH